MPGKTLVLTSYLVQHTEGKNDRNGKPIVWVKNVVWDDELNHVMVSHWTYTCDEFAYFMYIF
jgi:hypothetical protein